MTCIVGFSNGKTVWIGSDSAGSTTDTIEIVRSPKKVFQVGEMLIGYCGSIRMGQILQCHLDMASLPVQPKKSKKYPTDMDYLIKVFVEEVREKFKTFGFTSTYGEDNNQEYGGFFLVGYRGRLYKVESDFHISRRSPCLCGHSENNPLKKQITIDSLGSGAPFAIGSLETSFSSFSLIAADLKAPEGALYLALEIAGRCCTSVAGPFEVLRLDYHG